jgi:hypothetical protein
VRERSPCQLVEESRDGWIVDEGEGEGQEEDYEHYGRDQIPNNSITYQDTF